MPLAINTLQRPRTSTFCMVRTTSIRPEKGFLRRTIDLERQITPDLFAWRGSMEALRPGSPPVDQQIAPDHFVALLDTCAEHP